VAAASLKRRLGWAVGLLAVAVVVATVGIGWYYAGEILLVRDAGPPVFDTEVLAVDADEITLARTDGSARTGTWGLDFEGGYAQVLDVREASDDGVVRPVRPLDGLPSPGDRVRVDGYAFPPDPAAAFDFAVDDIGVDAELGVQPAWQVAGDPGRWAIFVHGRGGGRHECFRLLPLFQRLQWSSLCISYRNDPGTPADPRGLYRQGHTEWRDVEAAVADVLEQGAEQIVLVGYSMGGQITGTFLRRSDLARHVDGVIWDAPALDWGPAIAAGAAERGVPTWLVPIGMQASEWRAGVDYADLNHVANARDFETPVLLFHGTADSTVPVSVSDRFAAARPDLTTYERVEGAEHVAAWNVDRQRYERAVRDFLGELE